MGPTLLERLLDALKKHKDQLPKEVREIYEQIVKPEITIC